MQARSIHGERRGVDHARSGCVWPTDLSSVFLKRFVKRALTVVKLPAMRRCGSPHQSVESSMAGISGEECGASASADPSFCAEAD